MEEKRALSELREIAEAPFLYLRSWKKKTGKKILGYFCTNTPEETIHAAGLLPVRILKSKEHLSLASKHLQSYSCSLIQSCLEAGLRGNLDFLQGTVFPHTCDSIQRLSDIWRENLRFPFHWDLVLPVKLHTKSARSYLLQELRRFQLGLQDFIGHSISDEDLHAAIAIFNENRSLLQEFYRLRASNSGHLSAAEFLTIFNTAACLPKEEHNTRLRKLLPLAKEKPSSSSDKIRLFLAGSICDQPEIFDLLEACGASVVADDLCTGWRYFAGEVANEGDPLEALADRLIKKVPCPCKYNPGIDRGDEFLERVVSSRSQGVVFVLLKFCDPHAFDYPFLKKKLAEQKISSLLLEIEPGGLPLGGMETRGQAFVETLGG
ncbi:MAG: 2-hydroxyacyl-CoA dehydratase [Deltaproteobacteria bacterium]|nr:2-hydroxyacyl-CoA dehydratase [Deltaproteobacteria bacterium]